MREGVAAPAVLLTEAEARATAEQVRVDRGHLGERAAHEGGAYLFQYLLFAGGERARELEDALVTVTSLDGNFVRVQLAGWELSGRMRPSSSSRSTISSRV